MLDLDVASEVLDGQTNLAYSFCHFTIDQYIKEYTCPYNPAQTFEASSKFRIKADLREVPMGFFRSILCTLQALFDFFDTLFKTFKLPLPIIELEKIPYFADPISDSQISSWESSLLLPL